MNTEIWNGKTVWITGASSGIGEALAVEFSKCGANVVLSARREDVLEDVAKSCGSATTLIVPLDVTQETQITEATQTVLDRFGKVDLLINNAGISQRSLAVDTQMETYRKIFDVDVFGQIALTKAVLPSMIEHQSGHIAVTASVAGKMGVPFRTGYCGAKHAVMGFYDALRAEVDHHGIHVSTIVPGFIQTAISENAVSGDGSKFGGADRDISGGMEVDECAKVIVKGLSKRIPEIPVGKGMEMYALWIKRLFPNLLFKLMRKQFHKRAEAISQKNT